MDRQEPSEVIVEEARSDEAGLTDARAPGSADEELSSDAPEPESAPEPDYKDLYLREVADKDNLRKMMVRRQTETARYANEELARNLLPALEHFHLAIDHGEAGEGTKMALRELEDALAAAGLKEIPADVGAPFDPVVHEAVAMVPREDVDSDQVFAVQRRGYWFHDKVLRASQVVVAQPIPAEEA